MFYLKHFFIVVKNTKFSGMMFVLMTTFLISGLHNRAYLKKVFSMSKKAISRPYFNVLISNKVNLDSLKRKITHLPGVEEVTVKKSMDIGKELSTLSKELGSDMIKGLADINYASVTIEISNGLQERSQKLIKEYLSRLAGKDSVAISDVKTPKRIKLSKKDPYQFINNWGDFYLLGIFGVIWVFSFVGLTKYLRNYSYLIEKFQRKKNVAYKVFVIGFVAIGLVTILVNMYFQPSIAWEVWVYCIALFVITWFLFNRKLEYKKFI